MARMITAGGSSSASCLLLRRPTLQQPPPRPDHAWGVVLVPLCRRLSIWSSVKPVVLSPPASPPAQQLQTRVLCNFSDYIPGNSQQPKNPTTKKLWGGWRSRSRGQDDDGTNSNNARELLDAAMVPIREDLPGLDDGTRSMLVQASLTVLWQLLHTAPKETVGAALRQEISRGRDQELKSIMEKIVRDTRGTPAGGKGRQLAEGILDQLRSITK